MPSSSSHLKNRKNKTIIQSLIDGIKNGDYIYDKFSFTNDKFIIKDLELQTNSFNTDDLTVPTLKTNQIIFNDGNIFDFSGTVLRFGDYKIDLINVSNGDVSSIQFWEASYVNTRDLSVNRNAVINNLEVSGIEISNNAIVKNNLTVNNILTVDNSANILDLSVGSITLGNKTINEWNTSSFWKKDNSNISFSDGKVTIHKELDVSGLDVSNSAIIKDLSVSNNLTVNNILTVDKSANILDLSVGSITLGNKTINEWNTASMWEKKGSNISFSDGKVTIHKELDVSGLDVSNSATIKDLGVSNNLTVSNILTVDKSANILDLSVGSITLGNKTINEWNTSSFWKKDNSNISFSDGKVTIHKELDVSGLDVSNTAIIKNLNVTSITISNNTYTDLKNIHSSPHWNANGFLYYNSKDVSIGKKLDVSGLDVSNNAKVQGDLILNGNKIDISEASGNTGIIDINGKNGIIKIDTSENNITAININSRKKSQIIFNHDRGSDVTIGRYYANKIQSSWPSDITAWGKQRLEFIQNKNGTDVDMGYFDNSGLTIYGDLDMSAGNISSKSATIKDLNSNILNVASDASSNILNNYDASASTKLNIIGFQTRECGINFAVDDISDNTNNTWKDLAWIASQIKSSWYGEGYNNSEMNILLRDINGSPSYKKTMGKWYEDRINKEAMKKVVRFRNETTTIYNKLDVSGLDVSNSATIKDLILKGNTIDISEANGNTGIIDISGKNGIIKIDTSDISNTAIYINALRKSQIIFKHDDGVTPNTIGQWYANKIQSSWPDNSNSWGQQRLEFITSVQNDTDPRIDDISVSVMGYFDNSGLTIPDGDLVLSGDISSNKFKITDGDLVLSGDISSNKFKITDGDLVLSGDISSNKFKITDSEFIIDNSNFVLDLDGGFIKFSTDFYKNDIIDAANWTFKCNEIKGANNKKLKISESSQNYGIEISSNKLILKGNTIDISSNTGIIDISGKNGIIKIDTSDGDINAGDFKMKIFDLDVTNDLILKGNTIDISEASDNTGIIDISGKNGIIKIDTSDGDINAENFKMKIFDLDVTNDLILKGNTIDISEASDNTGIIDISGKEYNITIDSNYGAIKADAYDITCFRITTGDASFNKNVQILQNLVIDGSLTVGGNTLSVDVNKNWYTTSDDRIKHNEKTIENSLDILNNLQPYRYIKTKEMYAVDHHFQLNEQGEPLDGSGNVIEDYIIEMGVIAQDVEKMDYLKQLVHKPDGEDGIFYLRYNDLFVLNIDATKMLSNKVSSLENKDNDILAKINNIPVEECYIIEFKDNMEMNRDNTNRDDKGRYHSIKINTNKNSNSNWTISNRYFYTPIIKKTYNSENINIIKDIFNSDLYGSVNIDGTKLFPLTNSFIDIILEYNVTIEIESRIIDASKYNNANNNMFDLGFMFQMYSNLENNIYNNCYEKIQIHNVTPPLNEDFYNSDTNSDKKKYFTYTQQINKEFKLSLSPNTGDKLYKFLESAKNTTIDFGFSIFTNGFRNKDVTNTYPPSLYLDNYPWDRVEIPPSTKYANPDIDFKNPFYITVKSSSLKIKTKKLF